MFKKVLSVVLLVASGFFFYAAIFSAFIEDPKIPSNANFIMAGVFLIPALLTLLSGLALRSFAQWQSVCGIVLVSTAAFCAFLFLSMVCIRYSTAFESIIDPDIFSFFSDITSGVGLFALVLSSGAVLFYRGNTAS